MKVKHSDLENKKVFITGGGSGIGASIVESFCEQGCEVYFVDISLILLNLSFYFGLLSMKHEFQ